MIQSCTCNKRFTSSLGIPEGQKSSKSCRSCGGILSVDERGGLSKRMWNSMGSEFSRVIDPQLKWKISSNGKTRALRRARTFTHDNGKKSTPKDLKDIEDLFNKASKKEGDILVSESEKLGVSLLGRRFSDNLESFPIKKRIISLLPSQSTPNLLSSSGFHHNQDGHFALFKNNQVLLNQDVPGINPSLGMNLGHGKGSDYEKTGFEYIDEHISDSADFSGISILAAAACHSSTEKELAISDGPTVGEHSSGENPKVNDQLSPELINDIPKPSLIYYTTEKALGCEPSDECNVVHSDSLQSFTRISKPVPSRDDRLHWDLNTVMDVWESQPDDYSKCDLHETSNLRINMSHDMHFENLVSHQDDTCLGVNRVGFVAADNQCNSYSLGNLEEEIYRKHESPVADCDKGKLGIIQNQVGESFHGKYQFKDDKATMAITPKRKNHVGNGEKSCFVTTNTCTDEGDADLTRDLSAKFVDLFEKDNCETSCLKFSTERDTHAVCASFGHPIHAFDTLYEDKKGNVMLHDENRSIHTVDSSKDYSGECVYGRIEKNNQLWSPHVEKQQSLSTDEAFNVSAKKSETGLLDENSSGMIIGGDNEKTIQVLFDTSSSKCMTAEGCLSDETAYSDEFVNTYANDSQSIDILLNSHGRSNELLPSSNACTSHSRDTSADVMADDSKSNILNGETLNDSKASSPFHTNTKLMNSVSEEIILDTKGIPALLLSYGECRTPADVHVKSAEKDSVEEHFVHEHHLNVSPIDSDHDTGLEKVDFLGDDDSQYEDGELRESVLNSWVEDGAEEVETERVSVDYGSDCRDSFEAESDFCSQSDLPVGTTECKYVGGLITSCDGNILQCTEDSHSTCFQKHLFRKKNSNVSQGEGEDGVDMLKDSGKILDVNVASEVPARDENRFLASNLPTDVGDESGKASQPSSSRMKSSSCDKLPRSEDAAFSLWNNDDVFITSSINSEADRKMAWTIKRNLSSRVKILKPSEASSSRMKSSGWDKLPRSEDAAFSHWNNDWNNDGDFITSSIKSESDRRMAWTIKRDLSSRVKILKPSEALCKKEVTCTRENRKLDHIDLNAERSIDANRLDGRNKPFHSHDRGRVWVDPPDHHGSYRFDTSGYYSSPKFSHSGSRNAAADAVAKVESNGFLVAPDGTIVKGGSLGLGSHLSGHSSKPSAHLQSTRRGSPMENDGEFCTPSELSNSREASPGRCYNTSRGRDSRHDSRLFSLGHRNRFHAPILDNRNDSQSLQHPSSRRQHSISPHRKLIHLSREHTRSPSRSRTRSPHAWTSPRGRNDGRISGIPDVKIQTRSPLNFKPQRRIPRQRSPQHHCFPVEEFTTYAPPSRNHSSPPHTSRWFDNEKNFRDHLRENQPRRSSGKSPTRIFSQSNRLDDMNSRGRMKPDEYYETIYTGRFQEYVDYDRDDSGHGRRGRSNRHEAFHPVGHLGNNSNMNCHHYDDDSRDPNLRPKSFEFKRRQSPRTFDRSIDTLNEDSPRRIKRDFVHFRHGRHTKLNSDFNSFKVRDSSDDMPMQRKSS